MNTQLCDPGSMADELTAQNLDVYEGRSSDLWHPEHGDLADPEGWEFLPSGDAFVTRTVKAAGVYWTVWRPRGRGRDHRRKLGLLAPRQAIAAARARAAETAEQRAGQRAAGARHRAGAEAAYRTEFEAAVVAWLDFAPRHRRLAEEIARGAAERAVVVGSGRVGRTHALPLDERARLAARAHIRHRYCDYEDQLDEERFGDEAEFEELDGESYRRIKQRAQQLVDEFIDRHRLAGR